MGRKYKIRVNTDSLKECDLETVKKACEGVEKIVSEFPHAQDYFHEITGENNMGNAYASASYYGIIKLNSKKYGSDPDLEASYERDVKANFHPVGTTAKHITSHEAGHILERALIDKFENGEGVIGERSKIQAWNRHTYSGGVISEATKNAKKTAGGKGKRKNQLIAEVSGYANKNRAETLAECVADYAANGDKAKPLSIEVHKILKRELG